MAEVLPIGTTDRKQVVDLTDRIEAVNWQVNMQEGQCSLFGTHTTAALKNGCQDGMRALTHHPRV